MNTNGAVIARMRPEAEPEPAGPTRSKSETAGKAAVVIALALLLAAGGVSVYAHSVRPSDRRAQAKCDVREILIACRLYADDHAGQLPENLELLYPQYTDRRGVLGLPAPGQNGTPRYALLPLAAGATSGPQAVICQTQADPDGGRVVGWSDGSVTWVRNWQPAAMAGAE